MGGIERVYYLYGMNEFIGNGYQKLEGIINHYTIHMILHWAEKVIIKALHLNCLVD